MIFVAKKVVIIGVGNIGFRHFQALERLEEKLEVQVVDVVSENLEKVKAEYSANGSNNIMSLKAVSSVSELDNDIDYAIIATSSAVRRQLAEELLKTKHVQNLLLEKVLFQKMEDYDAVGSLIKEKGVNTWVSCCRRMNKSYQKLKKELAGRSFDVVVTGSDWGLGCNAIHLIDIICYLSSSETAPVCNADMLDNEIHQSKRPGYIEFTGTINGTVGDRVKFSVTSLNSTPAPVILYIFCENNIYIIREAEQKIFRYTGESVEEMVFEMPFLSVQGADIAKAILFEGGCTLPSYEVSAKIHKAMLSALLDKMGKIEGSKDDICKIT